MPSKGARKRLVDVLDEIKDGDIDSSIILTKFILLQQRIESHNPSIDNFDLRWVEHKIEQIKDGFGGEITKNDLLIANNYWNKWENK